MLPRRRKSNFTAKCLNTFVAHCRYKKTILSLILTSDGGAGTSKLCDVTDDREDVELVSSERDWKLRTTH